GAALELAGLAGVPSPFLIRAKLLLRLEMLMVGTRLPPPRLSPTNCPEASVRLPVSTCRLMPGWPSGLGLALTPPDCSAARVPASMGATAKAAFSDWISSRLGTAPAIQSNSRNRSLCLGSAPQPGAFSGTSTPLPRLASESKPLTSHRSGRPSPSLSVVLSVPALLTAKDRLPARPSPPPWDKLDGHCRSPNQ